ncbi:type I phosphodiesterase/nucleotide pyrophosphatase [Cellulomonas flavigena DSM 20109]|uniref:Type I phosphodiesterase/nucleotide pyrophosphatase n=1 Tax=Cellulomonas flavigena (strain ATCC 482 / DSM 20109 / BCRC 11376 / JCM 18109 / NBRC 3775 / NCIMB 8073 / NRS 134) TaxID=446466 RepID=D5UED3_CELFN|nr:nucleotide pyrophosphatase/phosphodiesterase family protein [Cellulomonas flavigena]ADG74593.1 type I phosphodiesterase/nucleotide pyrophosphatase [Cellulomonas flavigena DSM 20109]
MSTPTSPGAAATSDPRPDELVAPRAGARSLAHVMPAVASALGTDLPGAAQARALLDLPAVRRVCVVLVDGLGHLNLAERGGHAPFLRPLLAASQPLLSTFPSTTATAVAAFGTGRGPGETGMLGYTVRVPATGRLGNLVSWTDMPVATQWQPHPTVFERLVTEGVRVTSVGPARFHGSGLTAAALRGAAYVPAESLAHRVDAVVRALREPGLTYLYWHDVDKTGHHHGWGSWQWGEALTELDGELARLARSLPRDTLLLVTADHGMVDVDPARRRDVGTDPVLGAQVATTGGEPRALHLHVEDGVDPQDVATRWRDELGDDAVVRTRDEAVDAGWFGPVEERVRPVVGDVVVAMTGAATVVDSRTQTPASIALRGVHGSLTAREMLVPLLVLG